MYEKVNDPGFGNFSVKNIQRYVNKDGTFNIQHTNNPRTISGTYTYLITISWTKFFLFVLFCYTAINLFFACVYISLGIEKLTPSTGSFIHDYCNAFFFSAQTITTVGYGGISPNGLLMGFISSFEAMLGLLCFSFVTGLLYGRFSKPKASVKFSDDIILRDYKKKKALMFRIMNSRRDVMIRPHADVILLLPEKIISDSDDEYKSSFYKLKLERESITYLPTTWTLVHELDEDSPLSQYSPDQLTSLNAEIVILISYYDDSFNQEVHQVHSYVLNEIKVDTVFEKAFMFNEEGIMVFDHEKFNSTIPKES